MPEMSEEGEQVLKAKVSIRLYASWADFRAAAANTVSSRNTVARPRIETCRASHTVQLGLLTC